MQFRPNLKSSRPVVEFLEARSLLSGFKPLSRSALSSAMIGQVHPTIATDPAGIAAIMSALEGGMGREWVSLIRAGVKNPLAVIAGFSTGKYTSYSISGLTAETPSVQPAFAGQPYDQLLATVAGASVFKGNVLELGAIMRGPFHDPAPSYYVFAFNRGAGASQGATFASRPGITPDALVTLTVGPLRFLGHGNHHRPDDPLNPGDPLVEHRDPGPGRPRLPQDRSAPIQGLAASEVPLHFLDTNAARQQYLDRSQLCPGVVDDPDRRAQVGFRDPLTRWHSILPFPRAPVSPGRVQSRSLKF
ncbi:MAG: hypothetical protein WB773_03030 [Isosphaeraceae bacterium]